MTAVTFTTDLGLKDHYAAVLKGEILKLSHEIHLVDIANSIEPFTVSQAAFVLKNCYQNFPPNSIHVVCVDTSYDSNPNFVLVKHNKHFFIGPDNGVFSLVINNEMDAEVFLLKRNSNEKLNELFAKTIFNLLKNIPNENFAEENYSLKQSMNWIPQSDENYIRGKVIYIDVFQNCVTNISKKLFEEISKGRKMRLYFKRYDDISKISDSYADVTVGEKLAIFNEDGYLEIAVNKGNAAGLLGLNLNDALQVDFS